MLVILCISFVSKFGKALRILDLIFLLDLKKGPKRFPNFPPTYEANFNPNILKKIKRIIIIKNSKKYLMIDIVIN